MNPALIAGKLLALALFTAGAVDAAEIKVLASNALKTALEELGPQFEKASEHKLSFSFNAAVPLKAEIEKGVAFDVAILSAPITEDLVKQGKLVAATRADIARSGAGLAVKRGAPKPDISTPKPDISTTEAFKRTLLDAKSICYVEQGATGIYLKGLFERLGIAEQLKGKTKLLPPSNPAAHAVANGEAEIGMTQISEILPYAGAELVGPLPAEIQLSSVYPAAVGTGAKEPDAAKAFIKFLTTPTTIPVLKAKGLEPG
jgi:molybdate transport system substrate-binding protein